jgi:hypothetical protein
VRVAPTCQHCGTALRVDSQGVLCDACHRLRQRVGEALSTESRSRPVAVYSIVKAFPAPNGGTLWLVAVETWTTWFEIGFLALGHPSTGDHDLAFVPWSAVDDRGRQYDGIFNGGGSGPDEFRGRVAFVPPLATETSQLLIRAAWGRETVNADVTLSR